MIIKSSISSGVVKNQKIYGYCELNFQIHRHSLHATLSDDSSRYTLTFYIMLINEKLNLDKISFQVNTSGYYDFDKHLFELTERDLYQAHVLAVNDASNLVTVENIFPGFGGFVPPPFVELQESLKILLNKRGIE